MNIKINIENKHALVDGTPIIVCGNSDYTIQFTFDAEWETLDAKTARFVYVQNGKITYTDVVFTGEIAAVPILANTREVRVGVFAGDLHTTVPARIPCELSIRCGTGAPADPTPSQYDQIMELLNAGGGAGGGEGTPYAVQYVTQTLTETQQARARENINAAPADHTHVGLHTHDNADVLEKLTADGGVLQYDGKPIEGGSGGAVASVNGKTGAVELTATDVDADPSGTAERAISVHNADEAAHPNIRNAVEGKIAKTDIVDNLTTEAADKPLSAAQGAALKALIDALGDDVYIGTSEEEATASGKSFWLNPDEPADVEYVTTEELAAAVAENSGKVLLYSGSLAVGGSVTLEGLTDYDELRVYMEGVLNPCTLQIDHVNGVAGGGGVYLNSENGVIQRAVEGTVSGNVFKYTKTYIFNAKTAAHASSSAKISKIYGVR
jgi:hypothetical protein